MGISVSVGVDVGTGVGVSVGVGTSVGTEIRVGVREDVVASSVGSAGTGVGAEVGSTAAEVAGSVGAAGAEVAAGGAACSPPQAAKARRATRQAEITIRDREDTLTLASRMYISYSIRPWPGMSTGVEAIIPASSQRYWVSAVQQTRLDGQIPRTAKLKGQSSGIFLHTIVTCG